jgi:hypothetical protein
LPGLERGLTGFARQRASDGFRFSARLDGCVAGNVGDERLASLFVVPQVWVRFQQRLSRHEAILPASSRRQIQILCTWDLYNEGVELPDVNTLLADAEQRGPGYAGGAPLHREPGERLALLPLRPGKQGSGVLRSWPGNQGSH